MDHPKIDATTENRMKQKNISHCFENRSSMISRQGEAKRSFVRLELKRLKLIFGCDDKECFSRAVARIVLHIYLQMITD